MSAYDSGPVTAAHADRVRTLLDGFAAGAISMTRPSTIPSRRVFDWKAASERGEESSMGLTKACERFAVEPQLASILRNTVHRMGFKVD